MEIDYVQLVEAILTVIGGASLLLQAIPQLDKNNKLKPVLQFIGRFIALNKPIVFKK